MSTLKQKQASRANGRKSNGPTSPEGIAISSQNALRSGLYAKAYVIKGENPQEFAATLDRYNFYYQSANPAVEALVLSLVRTGWLLTRLSNLESEIWKSECAEALEFEPKTPNALAQIRGDGTPSNSFSAGSIPLTAPSSAPLNCSKS